MSVATNHFSGVMVNTTFSVMDKIIQVKTVGELRCEQIIFWKNMFVGMSVFRYPMD